VRTPEDEQQFDALSPAQREEIMDFWATGFLKQKAYTGPERRRSRMRTQLTLCAPTLRYCECGRDFARPGLVGATKKRLWVCQLCGYPLGRTA
jgi:hypothetical protein